jgi:hypothetical protein
MVTQLATDKDQPMIFMTAPPIIALEESSRFRVPRNLPYSDAPA